MQCEHVENLLNQFISKLFTIYFVIPHIFSGQFFLTRKFVISQEKEL